MAIPTAEDIILQVVMGLGSTPGEEDIPLRIDSSETCNRLMRLPYEIAAGGTDTSVNLGTYFDSLKFVCIVDKSGIGVKVGKASGAGKFNVRAITGGGGFMMICESATFTVYLDNLSGADVTYGEIIALGSSA